MLNAPVGVQRVIGRLRRPSSEGPTPRDPPDPQPSPWLRQVRTRLRAVAGIAHLPAGTRPAVGPPPAARPLRRSLIGRLGQDRVLAVVGRRHRPRRLRRERLRQRPSGPVGGPDGDGAGTRGVVGRRRHRRPTARHGRGRRPSTAPYPQRPGRSSPSSAAAEALRPGRDRRRGPVPRGRHAAQAGRGQHDRRGRQRTCCGPTRSRPATR